MSTRYRSLIQTAPPVPYPYDTDFQTNVLDVASTNGYPMPSQSKGIILNALMVGLKNDGLFGVGDTFIYQALNNPVYYQFGRIDWFRTGVLYTSGGTMIQTAYGEEGNGLDGYLNTNFNPTVGTNNYVRDSASRLAVMYKVGSTENTQRIDGIAGTNDNSMQNYSATTHRINSGSNLPSAVDLSGTGLKGAERDSSTNVNYYNKNVVSTRTISSTALVNGNQRLHQRNALFGNGGINVYYMGGKLGNTMVQNFRTRINTAMSDLGLSPIA